MLYFVFLRYLSIFKGKETIIIFQVSNQVFVNKDFLKSTDISLVLNHLKSCFLKYELNRMTLVKLIPQYIFLLNIHIFNRNLIFLFLKFLGLFKRYNIYKLLKSKFKYLFTKNDLSPNKLY